MAFHGVFSLINEKEEDNYTNLKLFMNHLWILQRKIPSLVSLIAFIEYNDSFQVEFYI